MHLCTPLQSELLAFELSHISSTFLNTPLSFLSSLLRSRHVIFAPSSHNKYAGESFPGIYDALFDIENSVDLEKAWKEVKRQISIAAFTVHAAAMTLTPPAWHPVQSNAIWWLCCQIKMWWDIIHYLQLTQTHNHCFQVFQMAVNVWIASWELCGQCLLFFIFFISYKMHQ